MGWDMEDDDGLLCMGSERKREVEMGGLGFPPDRDEMEMVGGFCYFRITDDHSTSLFGFQTPFETREERPETDSLQTPL
ncbi:hypothetical protein MRB53_002243 [Persea americana]|uniref:Uncharacterized protein n=1 Tax=Persea americana TaxID=3435 RepID=A0ACC2MUW3_PERAE|nr:hypothetical protein MRB53_002243 [Persea americana]